MQHGIPGNILIVRSIAAEYSALFRHFLPELLLDALGVVGFDPAVVDGTAGPKDNLGLPSSPLLYCENSSPVPPPLLATWPDTTQPWLLKNSVS